MDVHDFARGLNSALDKLAEVEGLEQRAEAAGRRLSAKQAELDALASAHAKLKEDSDKHLAANLAKMNEETARHSAEVTELKKKLAALQELHRTQQENASNTLTHLNSQIALAKGDVDKWNIAKEKMKSEAAEYGRLVAGEL